MRPFLLYRPGGGVPESVRLPLERAGADVLVAGTVEEAESLAASSQPEIVLVVPPGTVADGAALLSRLPATGLPPAIFVLEDEGAPHRLAALETIARGPWNRATAALGEGSDDPAPALLLSRVQLTGLIDLWEQVAEGAAGFAEHALRSLSLALDASRVTLYRWKAGSPEATVEASSLGAGVVGRTVEIVRYPELRAAAARSGAVLVEEVERDPLMETASPYLSGQPRRSLLCQLLPGDGSDLYLHAVREGTPFGLVDIALLAATARILQAAIAARRTPEPLEKGPDRKRMRTVQRILTGIPDATAMVGPSGEILLVNPPFCALAGRLESELVGLDVRSLLRPLAPEDAFTTLTPQPGSPVATTRARLVTAAGDTIPVEVLSIPTPDETAGKAGWSTITLRDRRREDTREARELVLQRDLEETTRQRGSSPAERAGGGRRARALLDGGGPRAAHASRDRAELPGSRPERPRGGPPGAPDAAPEDGLREPHPSRAAHRGRPRRRGDRARALDAPSRRAGSRRGRPRPRALLSRRPRSSAACG